MKPEGQMVHRWRLAGGKLSWDEMGGAGHR